MSPHKENLCYIGCKISFVTIYALCREMCFVAIYALLCGEKFIQKFSMWRKNDKYEVWSLGMSNPKVESQQISKLLDPFWKTINFWWLIGGKGESEGGDILESIQAYSDSSNWEDGEASLCVNVSACARGWAKKAETETETWDILLFMHRVQGSSDPRI